MTGRPRARDFGARKGEFESVEGLRGAHVDTRGRPSDAVHTPRVDAFERKLRRLAEKKPPRPGNHAPAPFLRIAIADENPGAVR